MKRPNEVKVVPRSLSAEHRQRVRERIADAAVEAAEQTCMANGVGLIVIAYQPSAKGGSEGWDVTRRHFAPKEWHGEDVKVIAAIADDDAATEDPGSKIIVVPS